MKFLIKKILSGRRVILITLLLSILPLASCVTESYPRQESRTLMDLCNYFTKCGLKPDKIQPTVYEALRASRGCLIWIQGAKVEVYIYDTEIKKQRAKLAKIKKNHKIRVLDMNIPTVVNGGMVMLTYSQHPNKAKIVRAFKKFPLDYNKK